MNIVDDNVIAKILNSYHANSANLKITQLNWSLNTKVIGEGNNQLSEVYRLKIEYQSNGNPQKTVLIVKAPCNCPLYEFAAKWGIYDKEETMYTRIFPQFYVYEAEYFTARQYYADENHSLFLEDLSQSGYRTADRIQQLDFQHSVLAMKRLAKLHGLSVHLERTSGLPQIIRKNPFHRDDKVNIGMKLGQSKFYNYLEPSIRAKYADRIEFLRKVDWAQAMDDLEPENSSFNVLNHGDYWTNNIMFKYDKYGVVENVKMIDFQLCRWGNPATDLIYFAISSIRYEVFSKYFHLLCAIYLDTLNRILADFGYHTYEMEELKKDIEVRYAYGIAVVISFLPIFASDPVDPFHLDDAGEKNEFDFTTMHKVYGQKHYMELATKWFLHFAQKDMVEFENE